MYVQVLLQFLLFLADNGS